LASVLSSVPLVLHEGNAVPGLVTRRLAGQARVVAGVFNETASHLQGHTPYHPTGLPIRENRHAKAEARAALDLPQEATVTLVMGGSQGAAALNEAVPEAYRRLPAERRPMVLHASGRGREAEVTAPDASYHVTGFVDGPLAWSAADLAITRAGVGTVSEAAFHGVPLIMMPLPGAADDHQRHNALAVAQDGAGWMVAERDVEGVANAWSALLSPTVRQEAAERMHHRSPEGAAQRLLKVATDAVQQERTT
jgi:UDP-N-acetylglucosamine--N-acetylmuramyl-(pentapeptide) pyrophosphoryl-undecaprenol N-acetylglucosamine transferase